MRFTNAHLAAGHMATLDGSRWICGRAVRPCGCGGSWGACSNAHLPHVTTLGKRRNSTVRAAQSEQQQSAVQQRPSETPLAVIKETSSSGRVTLYTDAGAQKLQQATGLSQASDGARASLASLFLPDGYPQSVTPDYLTYQVCIYLQHCMCCNSALRRKTNDRDPISAHPM